MNFALNSTAIEDYALHQRAIGLRVTLHQGHWWREVRPCFFRPLLPVGENSLRAQTPPSSSWLGGFQRRVEPSAPSNSRLALLCFTDAGQYSIRHLDYNRARQVRLAQQSFSLSPISSAADLITHGHPVYLDFFQRTGYTALTSRKTPAGFARWAEAVFAAPGALVLGAYQQETLSGVSVTWRIQETVHYATFFCRGAALENHLPDLMLHAVRQTAAASGAHQVFASAYRGGSGTDRFYQMRGASIVSLPCQLWLNPVARLILRILRPAVLDQLKGSATPPPIQREDGPQKWSPPISTAASDSNPPAPPRSSAAPAPS